MGYLMTEKGIERTSTAYIVFWWCGLAVLVGTTVGLIVFLANR